MTTSEQISKSVEILQEIEETVEYKLKNEISEREFRHKVNNAVAIFCTIYTAKENQKL